MAALKLTKNPSTEQRFLYKALIEGFAWNDKNLSKYKTLFYSFKPFSGSVNTLSMFHSIDPLHK